MAREPFAEKLTSKWAGAAFFWLLKGFQGKYQDQFIPKYDKRNLWTGHILNIIFFGTVFYFLITKHQK